MELMEADRNLSTAVVLHPFQHPTAVQEEGLWEPCRDYSYSGVLLQYFVPRDLDSTFTVRLLFSASWRSWPVLSPEDVNENPVSLNSWHKNIIHLKYTYQKCVIGRYMMVRINTIFPEDVLERGEELQRLTSSGQLPSIPSELDYFIIFIKRMKRNPFAKVRSDGNSGYQILQAARSLS